MAGLSVTVAIFIDYVPPLPCGTAMPVARCAAYLHASEHEFLPSPPQCWGRSRLAPRHPILSESPHLSGRQPTHHTRRPTCPLFWTPGQCARSCVARRDAARRPGVPVVDAGDP